MQDVTTLPYMQVMARYGAPDWFFTEFFRVHETSRLEAHILDSIHEAPGGRPVFAQLIGEHIPYLERAVKELLEHPIAGIDLNLGCPAPKVYKKNVGGGLLREPDKVDRILGALRDAVPGKFTVKMRVGFEDTLNYGQLLGSVRRHQVDLLSVHGRTVKQGYQPGVRYDLIARAVDSVPCPVLANGDVSSVHKALQIQATTGCAGWMVGRHAVRNPWIFRQLREHAQQRPIFQPTLGDVHQYIQYLWVAITGEHSRKHYPVSYLKKFLNFVGQGVDAQGDFLKAMRRAKTEAEMFTVCQQHLLAGGRAEQAFADEAYPGVVARPNQELPAPNAHH
jgi:tRNA-dihydrouridine synthase